MQNTVSRNFLNKFQNLWKRSKKLGIKKWIQEKEKEVNMMETVYFNELLIPTVAIISYHYHTNCGKFVIVSVFIVFILYHWC